MKINNVVRVPYTDELSFLQYWLLFLSPLHKLSKNESFVLALYIQKYKELQEHIKDSTLINKVLFSNESKDELCETSKLSKAYFLLIYRTLKEKGAIVDNALNPKYIPNVEGDYTNCSLLLLFDKQNGQ